MLTIDVYHQRFAVAFAALQVRAHDISPALHEIGYTLENVVRGRFESQSDPLGYPWALWKPSTVQSYPKDGHRRVLERYGDMLGSLNYQADASNSSVRVGFGGGVRHLSRMGHQTHGAPWHAYRQTPTPANWPLKMRQWSWVSCTGIFSPDLLPPHPQKKPVSSGFFCSHSVKRIFTTRPINPHQITSNSAKYRKMQPNSAFILPASLCLSQSLSRCVRAVLMVRWKQRHRWCYVLPAQETVPEPWRVCCARYGNVLRFFAAGLQDKTALPLSQETGLTGAATLLALCLYQCSSGKSISQAVR